MIEIENGLLKDLLIKTQRKCHILGKPQAQVIACVLRCSNGIASTTSIVRDGKTSLSRFSVGCGDGEETVIIPDIERLLGVLKAHGKNIRIERDAENNKICVKSSTKQTTLIANIDGLAFPHSRDTIGEWEAKSLARAEQIRPEGYYITKIGSVRPAMATWTLPANDLYTALSCDAVNKQMLNRYEFIQDKDGLSVIVGDEIMGQTRILLSASRIAKDDFSVVVEGGLDNVLQNRKEMMVLQFYDFRDFEQGIRLLMRFEGRDFVLQAGLL